MRGKNEVKEEMFGPKNFPADAAPQLFSSNSGQIINGEILEVVSSFNQAGSILLYESGMSTRTLWGLNASSGTNPVLSYPRCLTQANIGSVSGYGGAEPYAVNGPLMLSIGSVVSGTAANLNVLVRYR